MKRSRCGICFGLSLLLLLVTGLPTWAQEAQRVPVLQTWKGKFQTATLRNLAPTKLFIADQQSWSALWTGWRGNEPVPQVDFTTQLILVTTAPGQGMNTDLTWWMDFNGNLTSSEVFINDEAPGFTYVIQKINLNQPGALFAVSSVFGISLINPFACSGE
jgi:hypothetical protein